MITPLRLVPGWDAALQYVIDQGDRGDHRPYDSVVLMLAGEVALPFTPEFVSSYNVHDAARLVESLRRTRQPRRIVVECAHPKFGPPTNVIRCIFNRHQNRHINDGHLKARTMGEAGVRAEVAALRSKALHDLVNGSPLANDNDPALTTQPRWHTKVQASWVRRVAAENKQKALMDRKGERDG